MRIKRSITKHQRHKKIRKATKGMQKNRRRNYRLGKQAVIRSLQYAYRDRRTRKRNFRKLWIIRINAAAREHNLTYSQLIIKLKKEKINLNRKSLAELAARKPQVFTAIIESLQKKPGNR